MDSIWELMNWVIALRIQRANKSAAETTKRGPVKERNHNNQVQILFQLSQELASFSLLFIICSPSCWAMSLIISDGLNKSSILWRRQWHPTPVLLPGKSHGQRSLVGCSPWGRKESDTTEWLHFHFSLSCIGEGNGNPLQRSCLENPRDWGAWWAAVHGVAQSRTRLKRLSSSSSSRELDPTCHN